MWILGFLKEEIIKYVLILINLIFNINDYFLKKKLK